MTDYLFQSDPVEQLNLFSGLVVCWFCGDGFKSSECYGFCGPVCETDFYHNREIELTRINSLKTLDNRKQVV